MDNVKAYSNDHFAWSKAIWDVGAVAYLVNSGWTPSSLIHAPVVVSDHSYAFDERRHFIRSVQRMDRDAIFRDLFTKLGSCHERFPQAAKNKASLKKASRALDGQTERKGPRSDRVFPCAAFAGVRPEARRAPPKERI